MTGLANVATNIGTVATWFWGLFTDFLSTITGNALLLWPIVLGLCCAGVFAVIRVIKSFGLKGKR